MSFGFRLKQLRIAKRLTQEQLAKMVKLSKANISKYEADTVEPNLETLRLFADIFDVSMDYLINEANTTELIIPDDLKDVQVAFHRGEFEDLTQDEVDALAVLARTLKEQRKKKEESNS